MRRLILSTALAALLPLVPATASTLFSENFDGLAGGNYGTTAKVGKFTVTQNDVDIFGIPGSGYLCPSPNNVVGNNCLDLNGNANGQITSDPLSLAANTTYTVAFKMAGNGEPYYPSTTYPYTFDVSFGGVTQSFSIAPLAPFQNVSFNVATTSAKTSSLVFTSTYSGLPQYWGAVLDDIRITAPDPAPVPGAVPEPASWAMMVGGFGLLGAAMRRRRAADALAALA